MSTLQLSVTPFAPDKDFSVYGASYIGRPVSNTAMFISKKVQSLLSALETVKECLVFAEIGLEVPEELKRTHAFVFTQHPQMEYARFATRFAEERAKAERQLKFNLTEAGYYICEDSTVGAGALIEPGCVIGPDVKIGRNARILAGAVVRRATIGENVLINENAVIGANGFTMAEEEDGDKFRIPTLGRVIIGNNVEIGAHNNISCGSGGNTIIEDNVKLDALVHIGHDVHLSQNVEITAGATLGGFVEAGEKTYIGLGSILKNRITIGEHATIGMGAVIGKAVESGVTVIGNPSRIFMKN